MSGLPAAAVRSILLVAAFSLVPVEARAHAPIAGLGGFYNGLLHPLLVPGHLLSLVAAGLLIGRRERHRAIAALIGVPPALVAGLVVAALGLLPPSDALPMAVAAVLGVAVALDVQPPAVALRLAALAAGFVVGWDSGADEPGLRAAALSGAGVVLGAFYVAVVAAALALARRHPWQDIAVRVAGSWIAASALMVLALAATRPGP